MNAGTQIKADQLGRTVRLRILATSDLHMQITSFDYVRARRSTGGSLAKLATLIRTARKEAQANGELCVLVDNGDTWQGNPLADYVAGEPKKRLQNPMSDALNVLGYDALGLGNHDFDFGTDYLATCLAQTKARAICSNMHGTGLPGIFEEIILELPLDAQSNHTETLKIGILATVPDDTNVWNRHQLAGKLWFSRPVPALAAGAKRLRSKGADVVLALAHMGFGAPNETLHSQNQLEVVAGLTEIDSVVGGHTHRRFPDPAQAYDQNVPSTNGLIQNTPIVQPGASGSDLGQIHLCLTKTDETEPWLIRNVSADLVAASAETVQDPDILHLIEKAHQATYDYLDRPAARIANPMNTYFALAQPSPVQSLLAAAKCKLISKAIAGTELAQLPLLAVASATLTGGLDGPDNFIALEGGEIKHRHIAGMNPYANQVWAVRSSGARILDWLERSAVIFNTLVADRTDQPLINPNIPGFRYDVIFGLSYEIDPKAEPRYDQAGQRIPNRAGRVSSVMWEGRPIDPDQEFLVATTDHRAGGGGIYQPFASEDILLRGHAPLKAALLDYLENPSCDEVRGNKPWKLKPDLGVSAILLTAPEAVSHFNDISGYKPQDCGLNDEGFLRVRLAL